MQRTILATALLLGCAPWRTDARTWAPDRPAITAELAARARPITDSHGRLDVTPLWSMTRDARILAIGEATHGTHEFRELMLAVIRRAAAEHTPLVVALELSFQDGLRLDAWSRERWYPADEHLHARPFADPAVSGELGFGATTEYAALFTWIRAHNAAVAPDREIRVHGLDVCLHPGCVEDLAVYLADVEPAYAVRAHDLLAPLRARMHVLRADPDLTALARHNLATLRARLIDRRSEYIARRGGSAHTIALRLVRSSEQRVALALLDDAINSSERDEVMADTVAWIRERHPDARMLLLAHNQHLGRARDTLYNGNPSATRHLGEVLAQRYQGEYVFVHATLDRGASLTRTPRGRRLGPAASAFPEAPAGTLPAVLRRGGPYALDVRTAATGDGPLARWLAAPQWLPWLGSAGRRRAGQGLAWSHVAPSDEIDVLVYFPRTTPTTPL